MNLYGAIGILSVAASVFALWEMDTWAQHRRIARNERWRLEAKRDFEARHGR